MDKQILNIKKVRFDYEVKESFVAGVVLDGWMVKSIRAGKVSASDGVYIRIIKGEAWMTGLHITPVDNSIQKTTTTTNLKLLLTKPQLKKIIGHQDEKGFTTVLRTLGWKGHLVKAEICLVKGKKNHDKRKSIKEREAKVDAARAMKKHY